MLIYNPALDPYHAAVRLLALLKLSGKKILELEAVQLIDLLILYPGLLTSTKLPREATSLRKQASRRLSPFRQAPVGRAAIDSIRSIQSAAASTLAASGVLDTSSLKGGTLVLKSANLPPNLEHAMDSFIRRDSEYLQNVVDALNKVPLRGPDGLKARTGLMEFRYDQT